MSFLRDIHDSISMNHLRRARVFLCLSNHGNHLLQPAFSSDTLPFDSVLGIFSQIGHGEQGSVIDCPTTSRNSNRPETVTGTDTLNTSRQMKMTCMTKHKCARGSIDEKDLRDSSLVPFFYSFSKRHTALRPRGASY